jgi:hypothetical protein
MTSCAVTLLILSSWLYEFLPYNRRFEDDWLWLLLPLGAIAALVNWVRHRRRRWVHVVGLTLMVCLVASMTWTLSRETPEGMAGLGIGLGKALVLFTAYVAAWTAAICFAVACLVIAILAWRERRLVVPHELRRGQPSSGPM